MLPRRDSNFAWTELDVPESKKLKYTGIDLLASIAAAIDQELEGEMGDEAVDVSNDRTTTSVGGVNGITESFLNDGPMQANIEEYVRRINTIQQSKTYRANYEMMGFEDVQRINRNISKDILNYGVFARVVEAKNNNETEVKSFFFCCCGDCYDRALKATSGEFEQVTLHGRISLNGSNCNFTLQRHFEKKHSIILKNYRKNKPPSVPV